MSDDKPKAAVAAPPDGFAIYAGDSPGTLVRHATSLAGAGVLMMLVAAGLPVFRSADRAVRALCLWIDLKRN